MWTSHRFPPLPEDRQYQILSLAAIYQFEARRQSTSEDVVLTNNERRFNPLVSITMDEKPYTVRIHHEQGIYHLTMNDRPLSVIANWQIEDDGMSCRFTFSASSTLSYGRVIALPGNALKVILPDMSGEVTLPGHATPEGSEMKGQPLAPMSGAITAIMVKEGDTVAADAPLVIMEAMKMEHCIAAREAGVVEQILFEVGDQVAAGTQLLTFD